MKKKTILFLAAALIGNAHFAQSTGEIHGKLFDESGLPLPMANVFVDHVGGPFGTTTDMDGRFVLKPLQPGTYTLHIRYTGFKELRMDGVRVFSDRITRLDDQTLAMGTDLDSVEIIGWKRKLIDPEEPMKMSLLASEMEDVPLRKDPVAMLSSQFAGVTRSADGEGLHFRGSRTENMVYFVDGVKVTGTLSGVPPIAISSVSVYTGGLPARYGDVTGGVVAIETKSYMDVYQERLRR